MSFQYADLITNLASTAESVVRALDPGNRLEYFRVRSRKHEIMVAPDRNFTMFIIQNPSDSN